MDYFIDVLTTFRPELNMNLKLFSSNIDFISALFQITIQFFIALFNNDNTDYNLFVWT